MTQALDGADTGQRVAEFCDALEKGVAERMAAAPGQTRIPLAHVVLYKRPKN